jgi:hypothetical protein
MPIKIHKIKSDDERKFTEFYDENGDIIFHASTSDDYKGVCIHFETNDDYGVDLNKFVGSSFINFDLDDDQDENDSFQSSVKYILKIDDHIINIQIVCYDGYYDYDIYDNYDKLINKKKLKLLHAVMDNDPYKLIEGLHGDEFMNMIYVKLDPEPL